jgi:ubiquitin-conjugating enzyme E2 Z
MPIAAIKRIISKDVRSIEKQQLNDMGIYIEFNEENMLEAKAMIICPEDSVYAGGIMYFVIQFPQNYPYSPPSIKYVSRGSIRIHPNLYTGGAKDNYLGKVCLSILGTWSGPQWTTIMDISSVLISIQSLLDKNPLDHEPGYSDKYTPIHKKYADGVEYETYRTLICKNISDIPEPFLCFKDVIEGHYKQKKDNILSRINELLYEEGYDGTIIYIPIYRINIKLNYNQLKGKLVNLI